MTVSELDPLFVRIFAWLWGAVWGSFFNVAIHRWPRGLSVLSPPSHCPACGSPIPPWLNVPVFSYIALRGKARCCGAEIPIRYLLVEVLSAFLGLAIAERFLLNQPGHALGPAFLETLAYFAFSGALLIATFVDLEHTEIPDESSLGGMAIGLLSLPWRDLDPMDAAVGAGAAYLLSMLLPIWAWEQITGQRGMGEGDAKLLGCIGAFLGWQGVIFVVIASSVQGLLFYVISNIAKRGRPPSSHHHHNKPCAEPNPSQPAAEREHSPNPNHEANSSPSTDHGN
ncbi:MAG: prepilin peptidase, partial [Deltaproteobacteria bacterium]|nr:prepilin peptidase [Deltaproteobacteria bacterium]